MTQSDTLPIAKFLDDQLFENYRLLRLEGAGALSPNGVETARQQVLYYWRKLPHVARQVTDTEVRLTLAGLESDEGNEYTVEGVVDIVREGDRTTMYDVKTHEDAYVRANVDQYADQLNVYAYIWQVLRGEGLDETAIIATRLPERLWRAMKERNPEAAAHQEAEWDPLVPIAFDQRRVDKTVGAFGEMVDAVERGEFEPRPLDVLRAPESAGRRRLFATDVCRNCDARFTCDSYRQFAGGRTGLRGRHRRFDEDFRRFFGDYGPDDDREDALDDALSATATRMEIDEATG
jgi:hypothetical protein